MSAKKYRSDTMILLFTLAIALAFVRKTDQLSNIKIEKQFINTDHICSKNSEINYIYLKYVNNKIANQPEPYNTTSNYQKPSTSSTKPTRNFVTKFCKQDILKDVVKFLKIFCSFLLVEVHIRKLTENLSLHKTHVKKPFLTTLK